MYDAECAAQDLNNQLRTAPAPEGAAPFHQRFAAHMRKKFGAGRNFPSNSYPHLPNRQTLVTVCFNTLSSDQRDLMSALTRIDGTVLESCDLKNSLWTRLGQSAPPRTLRNTGLSVLFSNPNKAEQLALELSSWLNLRNFTPDGYSLHEQPARATTEEPTLSLAEAGPTTPSLAFLVILSLPMKVDGYVFSRLHPLPSLFQQRMDRHAAVLQGQLIPAQDIAQKGIRVLSHTDELYPGSRQIGGSAADHRMRPEPVGLETQRFYQFASAHNAARFVGWAQHYGIGIEATPHVRLGAPTQAASPA